MEINMRDLSLTFSEATFIIENINKYLREELKDVKLGLKKRLPFDSTPEYEFMYSDMERYFIIPHKYLSDYPNMLAFIETHDENRLIKSDFEDETKCNIIVRVHFNPQGSLYTLKNFINEFPDCGLKNEKILGKTINQF